MRGIRRALLGATVTIVVLIAALAVAGYFLFTRPHVDPLTKADAVVVLGGEDDGRVQYGMELARQGYAHNVVISTGFLERSPALHRACASSGPAVTVICFRPDPFTTQGEALTAQIAALPADLERLEGALAAAAPAPPAAASLLVHPGSPNSGRKENLQCPS